mmetsp:Transcript_16871/g.48274  ORF Transcript_16871/g.48274 Transcript_16871/m.48274 type:complete len:246 (+) Transcript_16871:1037-1774(+)
MPARRCSLTSQRPMWPPKQRPRSHRSSGLRRSSRPSRSSRPRCRRIGRSRRSKRSPRRRRRSIPLLAHSRRSRRLSKCSRSRCGCSRRAPHCSGRTPGVSSRGPASWRRAAAPRRSLCAPPCRISAPLPRRLRASPPRTAAPWRGRRPQRCGCCRRRSHRRHAQSSARWPGSRSRRTSRWRLVSTRACSRRHRPLGGPTGRWLDVESGSVCTLSALRPPGGDLRTSQDVQTLVVRLGSSWYLPNS